MAGSFTKRQKVVDIFSHSSFAPRSGCPKEDVGCVTRIRKAEELRNCDRVKAKIEFLPFPDSYLRGFKNNDHKSLQSAPEWDLFLKVKEEIRGRLSESEKSYFPLAIGRHVDHMMISRIGLELAIEEHNLQNTFFYEDQPYSSRNPRSYFLINLDSDGERLESNLISLQWREKWNLCVTYQSQFSRKTYWRIIKYAKGVKLLGKFYERIWKITDIDYFKKLLESQESPRIPTG